MKSNIVIHDNLLIVFWQASDYTTILQMTIFQVGIPSALKQQPSILFSRHLSIEELMQKDKLKENKSKYYLIFYRLIWHFLSQNFSLLISYENEPFKTFGEPFKNCLFICVSCEKLITLVDKCYLSHCQCFSLSHFLPKKPKIFEAPDSLGVTFHLLLGRPTRSF